MQALPIIEQNTPRVLATAQLTQASGTDERRRAENFSRNKDHDTKGKHFF